MKTIISAILLGLLQLSCQKTVSLKSLDWRGGGTPPSAPANVTLSSNEKIQLGSKVVEFSKQEINGIPVEGGFLKKISQGESVEFVSYQVADGSLLSLKADVFWMGANKAAFIAAIPKKLPEFNQYSMNRDPELVIGTTPHTQALWKVILESKDGSTYAFFFNKKSDLVGQTRVGSQASEVSAVVFPAGPLKSVLENVFLPSLTNAKNLVSDHVRVSTSSPMEAVAEDNHFQYSVDDARFYQVQSYFYVSQSFAWLQKAFQFSMPYQVEVQTAMGYPDKTNTAFYFDKKIRLGDGDDQVFSKIPLDPSIVTHESIHSVIEVVAHLPYEGEGGSLNEAFADYFTAIQFKNPNLGEASYKKAPFKRTILNQAKRMDVSGGLYHDSLIVSGLLWNLRTELGDEVINPLAWSILLRMVPNSKFDSFKIELMDLLSKENVDIQKRAMTIMRDRGWIE